VNLVVLGLEAGNIDGLCRDDGSLQQGVNALVGGLTLCLSSSSVIGGRLGRPSHAKCTARERLLDAPDAGYIRFRVPNKYRNKRRSVVHLHPHPLLLRHRRLDPEVPPPPPPSGARTLACTDTNGVYGAIEFQEAAESAGIRPILGAHLTLDGQEAVALALDEGVGRPLPGDPARSTGPTFAPPATTSPLPPACAAPRGPDSSSPAIPRSSSAWQPRAAPATSTPS
jgi:hypothetical protein